MKQVKRTRRKMTPEQKKAAAERLAAARAKRLKNNPPQYLSIHEDVRNLPEDNPLAHKSVKEWIKTNKQLRTAIKPGRGVNDPKLWSHYNSVDQYIKSMEAYLRDGVWTSLFYGEQQQNKIKYSVRKSGMAYNKDGTPKRSVGVWYEDIGQEYTQEMYNEEHKINISTRKRRKK